jgi:hypothetical protein
VPSWRRKPCRTSGGKSSRSRSPTTTARQVPKGLPRRRGPRRRSSRPLAAFERSVERARYDAGRARRQYDAVEPENRLVARTLERAWEDKLAAARQAENDLRAQQARRPVSLTSEELTWITSAGADIKAVFHAPTTTHAERKQLLRAVICEVVLTVNAGTRVADMKIIWQGGATTELSTLMNKAGRLARVTGEDVIGLVTRLAARYDDATIAVILAKQRRRTATGLPWTRARVTSLRAQHRIPACPHPPANVTPPGEDAVVVSITRAEKMLGVSRVTLYRWLRDGFITGEQMTPGAPWQIRIDQALRDKIQPGVPDGWLPLDAAAKALGIARQTVLHKVQRGELQAVHVNSGRRKGLRIQVKRDQPGLFDTPDKQKGAVLTMTGPAGEYQVLPGGPADRDPGLSAGLLGPQHRDQRRELPGGHLQAGQRGQAASVRTGVGVYCGHRPRPAFPASLAVLIGDGAGANLPPARDRLHWNAGLARPQAALNALSS